MQIGVVAKKIGLSVDAIRFYERNGLLPRPPRTEGGFRRYAENDVETLAFVRRVQGLGFQLREIRELLRLRGNRLQPCAPVQRRVREKLAVLPHRSAALGLPPLPRDPVRPLPRSSNGRLHSDQQKQRR